MFERGDGIYRAKIEKSERPLAGANQAVLLLSCSGEEIGPSVIDFHEVPPALLNIRALCRCLIHRLASRAHGDGAAICATSRSCSLDVKGSSVVMESYHTKV